MPEALYSWAVPLSLRPGPLLIGLGALWLLHYGPEGIIPHNDPKNPLGERWIDLGDSYGIHGTIEPDSIGTAASRGCIRLRDADIIEVYNFLVNGSLVEIRE